MDGTLYNTEPHHAIAFKMILDEAGFNIKLDWSALEVKYKGWSDIQLYHEFMKFQKVDLTLADFLKRKNEVIIKMFKENPPQMHPQMKALIEEAQKKKLKRGLVTSSERQITMELLSTEKKLFECIITREDTPKNKPDPAPYFLGFKKLNCDAKRTVIFEDSPTGLASANATSALVYKVEWFA
ncbi:MAG: HAD family phosphatase [Bacteriovoracaceae bacterium]|nr:HAD family phosphatase [Bacteriovoracaceae bacterium]